jgi:hypothetical protein
LELQERTGRCDNERDAADRGGDNARPSLTRFIEKALDGARTLAPDQVIELADDLSPRTASVLKTRPAIPVATNSTGAITNNV